MSRNLNIDQSMVYSYDLQPEPVSILDIRISSQATNRFEILRLDAWLPANFDLDSGFEFEQSTDQIGMIANKTEQFNRFQMNCSFNDDYYKMVEALRYFFTRRVAQTNHNTFNLNFPQVQYCITFLTHLKDYLQENWPYDMDGSRILIALNHSSNDCAIKLVDKSKLEPREPTQKDQSFFIDGLDSII